VSRNLVIEKQNSHIGTVLEQTPADNELEAPEADAQEIVPRGIGDEPKSESLVPVSEGPAIDAQPSEYERD
jgi:hypothetical protein